jgi:hypothetical protein
MFVRESCQSKKMRLYKLFCLGLKRHRPSDHGGGVTENSVRQRGRLLTSAQTTTLVVVAAHSGHDYPRMLVPAGQRGRT